jgi:hypothetical protein
VASQSKPGDGDFDRALAKGRAKVESPDFKAALKQSLISAMEDEMKMLGERRLRLQRKLDKVISRMNKVAVELMVEKEEELPGAY